MASITNVTETVVIESIDGGQPDPGPTPPNGGEEVYPMPTSSIELTHDESRTTIDISDTSRLSLQNNDLLIAAVQVEQASSALAPDEAGWTELASNSIAGGTFTVKIYYRIVNTGTDPTAYGWGGFGTADLNMRMIAFRGADPTTPFPDSYAYSFVDGAGSTSLSSPDITTSINGMALLRLIFGQVRVQTFKTFNYTGGLVPGYSGSLERTIVLPRCSSAGLGTGAAFSEAAIQFLPTAGAAGVWNLLNQSNQQSQGYTIPIAPAP